jgi:hypothetical protein
MCIFLRKEISKTLLTHIMCRLVPPIMVNQS